MVVCCALCFCFVVVYYDAFVVNNTKICCYKYLLLRTEENSTVLVLKLFRSAVAA